MRILLTILTFCVGIIFTTNVSAQKLTKAEKKEAKKWKQKMKSMDPLKFKAMYEDVNSLQAENGALKKNITKMESQLKDQQSLTASKDQEISDLHNKLKAIQADCGKNVTEGGDDYTKGVVYKVQIGAFRNKDLSQFQEKGNFWTEDEDGVKKYTIGFFRDYWEADTFKKYLREMGVKDAWIVAYEDNQRKDIKEVLEGGAEGASGR
ncbi:SPOR domain-containing protein [Flexithrix dorotheae]|uniref:SPOR domain-containing protein n=1 Tax=Flexithrix dorotheae TaxID=70993 RepID=UPI00038086F7|nr:SPOR domain-containing protein [Flexithrix dorotheae]